MTTAHEADTVDALAQDLDGFDVPRADVTENLPAQLAGAGLDHNREKDVPRGKAANDHVPQAATVRTEDSASSLQQPHLAKNQTAVHENGRSAAKSDVKGDTSRSEYYRRKRLFWRVATPGSSGMSQHHGVAEPDSAGRSSTGGAPQGISAFLGKVLNQLSLSAWLPAVMLVGSLAVMLQLHAQPNRSVDKAVIQLVNKPLGLLILLLFAIILTTMVTQAFEFEVIRILEGYWGDNVIARGLSFVFIMYQRRKVQQLLGQRRELRLKAFHKARLLERGIVTPDKRYIVDLINAELTGHEMSIGGWRAKKKIQEAEDYPWRQFAPASLAGSLDSVETRIDEYPKGSRLLPTKLGNVLRAIEDTISTASGTDLERYVITRWDSIPNGLQQEHDQYRTRLDLYCTLVFVFLLLAAIAPPLITLGPRYLIWTIAVSVAYLGMSVVSYAAAVASARGYGNALKAIADTESPVVRQDRPKPRWGKR